MDVQSSLFSKVDELRLLAPLSSRPTGHRMYIYAYDVVLFTHPSQSGMGLIQSLLQAFGEASGLKTNLAKSTAIPIRCQEGQVNQIQQSMVCEVTSFPCKYLGLPLSLNRLRAADL